MEMTLHCGPKNSFGASGPPEVKGDAPSLKDCLEKGVETNARLQAKEPWKLYFPEEVVLVANFKALDERACLLSSEGNTDDESKKALCGGATEDPKLGEHL